MNWKKVIQLTMIHVGVSITVVPVTSTLNRVMIADLGFPAVLVGILVSLAYLLSPVQAWMGAWQDRTVVWGRHRTPWIVLGGLMASFGSYLTAHAAYLLVENTLLGLLACLGAFLLWGLGVNIASVSYLSLVSELSPEGSSWRSRATSVMWTVMILSTIATGILISLALEEYSRQALFMVFGVIWMISSFLVLVGASNLEPAAAPGEARVHQGENPLVAVRALVGNPSAQRFFVYLLLILMSIHMQDVLLEPYGAQVLGMEVAETSRLTSIWGVGVFITLIGGLPLIRRRGKKPVANLGSIIAAVGFALIILAGLVVGAPLLVAAMLVLGLGVGLMTVANISYMFDMTVPQAAGLYMGAWGAANFGSQGLGNIVGTLLRDTTRWMTGSDFAGYAIVFGLEIAGLLAAIVLFRTITVSQFRRDAETRLADVLAVSG